MSNLLRPNQVEDNKEEVARIEHTLLQPHVQGVGELQQQLRSLRHSLDTQTPIAFSSTEVDGAVSREQELLSEITEGMPTQAEMRRSPPGAVSKHMNWETRNKAKIVEWKNLKRRLHAGENDPDAANLERYRPVGGGGEMNMDNAQIAGTDYFIPQTVTQISVMSEDESKVLKDADPELHGQMALLSNEQRKEVLDKVRGFIETPTKKTRKKREWSDADRAAVGKRLANARAAKAKVI